MMISGTVVKHASRTPATRPLSKAEAEDFAVITGAAETLGMQTMMTDLQLNSQVRVWTDATAANATASVRRILGEQNLADHLTKGKSWREIDQSIRGV